MRKKTQTGQITTWKIWWEKLNCGLVFRGNQATNPSTHQPVNQSINQSIKSNSIKSITRNLFDCNWKYFEELMNFLGFDLNPLPILGNSQLLRRIKHRSCGSGSEVVRGRWISDFFYDFFFWFTASPWKSCSVDRLSLKRMSRVPSVDPCAGIHSISPSFQPIPCPESWVRSWWYDAVSRHPSENYTKYGSVKWPAEKGHSSIVYSMKSYRSLNSKNERRRIKCFPRDTEKDPYLFPLLLFLLFLLLRPLSVIVHRTHSSETRSKGLSTAICTFREWVLFPEVTHFTQFLIIISSFL